MVTDFLEGIDFMELEKETVWLQTFRGIYFLELEKETVWLQIF